MSEPSWNDLSRGQPQATPKPDNEFDVLCMQVFTSVPGKLLLAALRRKHFDSPFNPMAPERALALRIGAQHFVRELETACERGLETNKRKP